MALPPKVYQFLVAIFASLGSLLYGYDLGVIASAIASANFNSLFKPSESETGAVVSVFTGGGFVGAMFAGPLGDRLGRKWTILMGSVIFCLGGGLQTGAQGLSYLYAGRLLAACFTQFPDSSSKQWRVSLAIQIIPAGLLAMLIMLFPESPRWLIDRGQPDKGLQTLANLHAHGNTHDPWVIAEFNQIQDAVTYEHEHAAKSYVELFKNKSSFRRLFLAMKLQASVQMTGVSAIQYYSVIIFEQIGITGGDALKYQCYNSVIALFGQILCMLFIDKLGRRWPLILGNLFNCLCFIIATILLAKFPPSAAGQNHAASWGFIASTWLYNFSFSSTCGPLSWIIPAEIFDTYTRSKGVSIATMTSFAFNTMIGQTTGIAMKSIRYRWYYLFCVCNFTNALFFWAFMPETAKRPLEEMTYLFTHAPWFVPTTNMREFDTHDLERRVEEAERKQGVTHVVTRDEKNTIDHQI
ncbi:hypothetical protein FKW77_007696 [Venturia effusa]|uniref:Major facilitator superfamily (MFS) profile domain-containing protein n=1 Tax=Venturia effusa TaxID=50376 RepID=A0A517LE52_9PEZI|nr:hypothetical protein FKW77_007696 [Venturia effusa]